VLHRWNLQADRYLLAVGSIDPRKNLSRLAAAYGRLSEKLRRELPLVIVGGGSDVFRQQFVAWPTGAVLTGYLRDAELSDLYRHARAVVMPSLAEGFGLPVVEAASAGVPLLLSDIPAFRWVYGEGAKYFDPLDVDSIASTLEQVVNAGPFVTPEELIAKAREVRERFPWRGSADRIYEFVQSLEG
jgi:glycosyltransferase involved in cell wall biosynthesis